MINKLKYTKAEEYNILGSLGWDNDASTCDKYDANSHDDVDHDHGGEGFEDDDEDAPLAAFSLTAAALHSALCSGQCARMHAFPQK
jgi:hypothetical protein